MKKKLFFLILSFPAFRVLGQSDKCKIVLLPDSSVSISVPSFWNIKSPYRQFPSYEIRYNAEVGSPKSNTSLKVDVFDSTSRINFFINDESFEFYRDTQAKTIGKLDSVKKEVVVKNGFDVAVLKYVHYDRRQIPRYGMIVFFRRDSNSYYEFELSCGRLSVDEGKSLAEKIVESLRLN